MDTTGKGQVIHDLQDLDYTSVGLQKPWKDKATDAGIAAWEAAKATYDEVSQRALASSRATDRYVRNRPYEAMGIAFGLGIVVGFLINRD